MRFVSALLLGIAVPAIVIAQSLSIYDVGTTTHPAITARILALDASGKVLRPLASDVRIQENGLACTVSSVSCPSPSSTSISAVIAVDVSSSMIEDLGGITRLQAVKQAARTWVDELPTTQSECAVTAFDDWGNVMADFTTDRAELKDAIDSLRIGAGTRQNIGLFEAPAGALELSKAARNARAIVFITDGIGCDTLSDDVIQEANRQGCSIYVITLGMRTPNSLRTICKETGGRCFDNIASVEALVGAFRTIRAFTQNELCEITWTSSRCIVEEVRGAITVGQFVSDFSYATASQPLTFNTPRLHFECAVVRASYSKQVIVKATTQPVHVSGITLSNPALFSISPAAFTLVPGDSVELALTYTSSDSAFATTRLTFEMEHCSVHLDASASFRMYRENDNLLRLTHPVGGETFTSGEHVTIRWEGIPTTDRVRIEQSPNAGKNWNLLSDSAIGGSYNWIVPAGNMSQCMIKVTRLSPLGTDVYGQMWRDRDVAPWTLSFGPNDSVLVGNSNAALMMIRPQPHQILKKITTPASQIFSIQWNTANTQIAVGGAGGYASIWDVATFAPKYIMDTVGTNKSNTRLLLWSPDNTKLLSLVAEHVIVWDAATGTRLQTLRHSIDRVMRDARWHPDGKHIVTESDGLDWPNVTLPGVCTVWDATTGDSLRSMTFATPMSECMRISQQGDRVAVVAQDGKVHVWNPLTGQSVHTITLPDVPFLVDWNPDGSRLLISYANQQVDLWDAVQYKRIYTVPGAIAKFNDDASLFTVRSLFISKVYETASGRVLQTLGEQKNITGGEVFSRTSRYVATFADDVGLMMWQLTDAQRIVDSSAVFTIRYPQLKFQNVKLGRVVYGDTKDSVVHGFVSNTSSYAYTIDSVVITGGGRKNFRVVSGGDKRLIQPSQTYDVEFGFFPAGVGFHSASIAVYACGSISTATLSAECVAKPLVTPIRHVSFGQALLSISKPVLTIIAMVNATANPLRLQSALISGPGAASFYVDEFDNSEPFAPEATSNIGIRFSPTQKGRTTAVLSVGHSASIDVTSVLLSGEGVTEVGMYDNDQGVSGEGEAILPSVSGLCVVSSNLITAGVFDVIFRVTLPGRYNVITYDMNGRELGNTAMYELPSGMHRMSINLSSLTTGLYVVALQGEGSVASTTVCIVR